MTFQLSSFLFTFSLLILAFFVVPRLPGEVRMTVQIEKHSLEIEAKLQKAEEQSQNEKRVEDKERMQKSQEVR